MSDLNKEYLQKKLDSISSTFNENEAKIEELKKQVGAIFEEQKKLQGEYRIVAVMLSELGFLDDVPVSIEEKPSS